MQIQVYVSPLHSRASVHNSGILCGKAKEEEKKERNASGSVDDSSRFYHGHYHVDSKK
jgi:hypothetical protein